MVVHPELAYPTYDIGARLAGATPVAADGLVSLGPQRVRLCWLNSPSNPTGRVLPAEHLRKVVHGRASAAPWSPRTSATSNWAGRTSRSRCCTREVSGGSHEGLLAVHSLSKRSNHGRLPGRVRHR